MRLLLFNKTADICSLLLLIVVVEALAIEEAPSKITWLQHMRIWRKHIKDCMQQNPESTWNCTKISTVNTLQSLLAPDTITIYDGIRLVRMPKTAHVAANDLDSFAEIWAQRKSFQHVTFFDELAMVLARCMHTHVLQVNFEQLSRKYMRSYENNSSTLETDVVEGRFRRQRQSMMMTMMFGVTALGAVLVPMGFQLLSIVSGKSLLLAKMALLLASINGLKRVANTGLHYGLYHVPHEQGGYYDRADLHHPRAVLSSVTAHPHMDFGL